MGVVTDLLVRVRLRDFILLHGVVWDTRIIQEDREARIARIFMDVDVPHIRVAHVKAIAVLEHCGDPILLQDGNLVVG